MRDDVFAEKIDRVHGLFVWNRPELHHGQELIELRFLLQPLDLLDHGVGAAAGSAVLLYRRRQELV